jgi:Rrf2 family protein
MKFSTRFRYGLRAMTELAGHYDKKTPLSAKSISESQGISLEYLEQILNRLKNKHLIKTIRGPKGGYMLSRTPAQINVKDIMGILEDNGFLVDCLNGEGDSRCKRTRACLTRPFWQMLYNNIIKTMESTTLKDLSGGDISNIKTYNNIKHRYLFQI